MLQGLIYLLFPPKCILCRKLLSRRETYLCRQCHNDAAEFTAPKRKIPFVAQWTGIWYYKDTVRDSIRRFKFCNARSYALPYAQMLALRLQREDMTDFDFISWIPVSTARKRKRGYDQGELLARALSRELHRPYAKTLHKLQDNPPQSGFSTLAQRRANVLGVYQITDRRQICGKRILLLDDVITTGSTASECAKTLTFNGAKQVMLAAVAVADKNK